MNFYIHIKTYLTTILFNIFHRIRIPLFILNCPLESIFPLYFFTSTILCRVTSYGINQYAKSWTRPVFASLPMQFLSSFFLRTFFILPLIRFFFVQKCRFFLVVFLVKLLKAIYFQRHYLPLQLDMAYIISGGFASCKEKIRYSITRKRDYISLWFEDEWFAQQNQKRLESGFTIV